MDYALKVKNITKVYKLYNSNWDRIKEIFFKKELHRKFIANKDISFDLKRGETLGIIGVNGAGKSTILKIITGVINPTSGEVIRYGKVTALLELGTGFNPELNGYENIFLNGTLIGMTKYECERKLKDIIDFSELGEYIYEPLMTYSSGMIMRLAFSIAIFSEPEILIVDEALSVGDAHFSAKCTRALNERKKDDMSIIYVSHDLNSLKLLCDRVILLNKGEVAKEGDPQDVINSYNFFISKLNDEENKIVKQTGKKSSFGSFEIEIISSSIKGEMSNSDILSSGEMAVLKVRFYSKKDLNNMTVGFLIKDKFGQDIFGTNTYYHNKPVNFKKDTEHEITFEFRMNLGAGKYSVTVAVHSEDTHLQNCAHWLDDAMDFEVAGTLKEQFIGLCMLEPKITFK